MPSVGLGHRIRAPGVHGARVANLQSQLRRPFAPSPVHAQACPAGRARPRQARAALAGEIIGRSDARATLTL